MMTLERSWARGCSSNWGLPNYRVNEPHLSSKICGKRVVFPVKETGVCYEIEDTVPNKFEERTRKFQRNVELASEFAFSLSGILW